MLCSSIKVNSINNCANSKITVLIPFAFESEESPSERERHSWYGISVLKMCCLSQTTAHYHLKWAIIIVGSSKWVLSLVGALTAIFVVFVSVLHLLLNRWVDEKKTTQTAGIGEAPAKHLSVSVSKDDCLQTLGRGSLARGVNECVIICKTNTFLNSFIRLQF